MSARRMSPTQTAYALALATFETIEHAYKSEVAALGPEPAIVGDDATAWEAHDDACEAIAERLGYRAAWRALYDAKIAMVRAGLDAARRAFPEHAGELAAFDRLVKHGCGPGWDRLVDLCFRGPSTT